MQWIPKDILNDELIKLDENFKLSFVVEIIKVVNKRLNNIINNKITNTLILLIIKQQTQ